MKKSKSKNSSKKPIRSREAIEKELERYRQLMDETMKNLVRVSMLGGAKIKLPLAIAGILIFAIGGVAIVASTVYDIHINGHFTYLGILGMMFGVATLIIGYMVTHKGVKGSWL